MERVEILKGSVLTVQEVSSYLRVHPSTIYRMLKRNQLPAFRVGSDWRFTVEAIDQWRARAEASSFKPDTRRVMARR
jgi:excisionase family DNA binding protein